MSVQIGGVAYRYRVAWCARLVAAAAKAPVGLIEGEKLWIGGWGPEARTSFHRRKRSAMLRHKRPVGP